MRSGSLAVLAVVSLFAVEAAGQWQTSTTPAGAIYYNGGNVGIGTDSPSQKLEVAGNLKLTGTYPNIWFGDPLGSVFIQSGVNHDASGSGGYLNVLLGNHGFTLRQPTGNPLTVSTSGFVGLGTIAPQSRLDLLGDVRFGLGTGIQTGFLGLSVRQSSSHVLLGRNLSGDVAGGTDAYKVMATTPDWGYNGIELALGGNINFYGVGGSVSAGAVTPAKRMVIEGATGHVGIGVVDPEYALHVNGAIHATQVIGATFQDIAEWVTATDDVVPGTVVVLDRTANDAVKASWRAYDTAVAGVVSAQPGIELGRRSEEKRLIATTGRVKVRVDASKHPVQVGDLLVTGEKRGMAMVSTPIDVGGVAMHRPGTLIGKALEPLAAGEGEVLVLLSLQ